MQERRVLDSIFPVVITANGTRGSDARQKRPWRMAPFEGGFWQSVVYAAYRIGRSGPLPLDQRMMFALVR